MLVLQEVAFWWPSLDGCLQCRQRFLFFGGGYFGGYEFELRWGVAACAGYGHPICFIKSNVVFQFFGL